MKHIKIFGRYQLKNKAAQEGWLENPELLSDTVIMSIYGSQEDPLFIGDFINVLPLQFDDATPNDPDFCGKKLNLFSEIDIDKINAYIEKHKEVTNWYIHCHLGISRSGAVGLFLCDYFSLDYEKFKQDNPWILPNPYVYATLKSKLWNKVLGAET